MIGKLYLLQLVLITYWIILENSKIKVIATPSTGTNHIAENSLVNNKFQIISNKESKVIEDIYASSEFSFTLLLALKLKNFQ